MTITESGRSIESDPLAIAADTLTVESLLRCWVRENNIPRPVGDTLAMHIGDIIVNVPIHYWSETGLHRFGSVVTVDGQLNAAEFARLLANTQSAEVEGEVFVARVSESAARVA